MTAKQSGPAWEIRKLYSLPRGKHLGIGQAVQNLKQDEFLLRFVPDGSNHQAAQSNMTSLAAVATKKYPDRQYHTRQTPEGICIWWEPREAGVQ